jgi:ribonucleoside-triphosphate reductase (formate)
MDGSIARLTGIVERSIPGSAFGDVPLPARPLDPGMGVAVARRTVFRPEDNESFGLVADRVAAGNIALLGRDDTLAAQERARLRNAIATGALLTSGRHLQHGDLSQPGRNMEVFTNCATAASSFAKFYLLLNGSGVGRSYDDALMAVDWANAPDIQIYLSPTHPDHPAQPERAGWFAEQVGIPTESIAAFVQQEMLAELPSESALTTVHRIADSREGWAKAIEVLEAMAFHGAADRCLVFDLSEVRPAGSPILGMQGRPASGPVSLLRAFLNIRREVIAPSRQRDPNSEEMAIWEQTLRLDHHLSVEVQVGGARRAARMATKSWRDPGVLRFIRLKELGGLWTANNSVMVDADFWQRIRAGDQTDELTRHARAVFEEATRCAFVNGEPGFINVDQLEDHRTGVAWQRPIDTDGSGFRSQRYQVDAGSALLTDLTRRAARSAFPVTTNPCGEITLHVTGGYCVIADFAPLLACPVPFSDVVPGTPAPGVAALWDARVEDSVRLGIRFLMRANTMDSLYAQEVARTNRMGIGPTGLHEYAWMRFGLSFVDLLDPKRSAAFWTMLEHLSEVAKDEADQYAQELGLVRPVTVTTIKPSGTISKLFGLTEGAHLPARAQYLRWVQFKGVRDPSTGRWTDDSDPLLADYEARGYPLRSLKSFPGMTIVGFPTIPLIMGLGLADQLVTASEATPAQQYQWLRLLERHWIGAEQGNQVSYTLKLFTDRFDLATFRQIVLDEQPNIRCCAILPTRPDHELGYEYLPEEEVSAEAFAALVAAIDSEEVSEGVDMAHLQCASGVCPI